MRDVLFPSSPVHRGALVESARCRTIAGMYETADPGDVDFVHGGVAGTLRVAPLGRVRVGVGHALALNDEVSHLPAEVAEQVLASVLGAGDGPVEDTPGELRSAAKKAAIAVDAEAARKRHEQAKKDATGVRAPPEVDGDRARGSRQSR